MVYKRQVKQQQTPGEACSLCCFPCSDAARWLGASQDISCCKHHIYLALPMDNGKILLKSSLPPLEKRKKNLESHAVWKTQLKELGQEHKLTSKRPKHICG